jgi:hypothetical protein
VLIGLASTKQSLGRPEEAKAHLEESITIWRELIRPQRSCGIVTLLWILSRPRVTMSSSAAGESGIPSLSLGVANASGNRNDEHDP